MASDCKLLPSQIFDGALLIAKIGCVALHGIIILEFKDILGLPIEDQYSSICT